MNLTPQQSEQVCLCVLRYCLTECSEGLILAYLRAEGFSGIQKEDVALQIRYLLGKGLLESPPKLVHPENRNWLTTPNGMDYLAQR